MRSRKLLSAMIFGYGQLQPGAGLIAAANVKVMYFVQRLRVVAKWLQH